MKILHVTPSYWPATVYGGPTVSISQLCQHQYRLGHEVFVLTTTANGTTDFPRRNGEIVRMEGVSVQYFRRLTRDHSHFSPMLLLRLWRCCRNFDAVHVHSWWNLVAIPATLVCRLRGVRPFFSPRGMLSGYSVRGVVRRFFHKTAGKWLLRRTVLHVTGKPEQAEAQAYIPGWPSFLLPNIVELSPSETAENQEVFSKNKPFEILFLGRLHPIKRLELVIEALAETPGAWTMTVAGDGEAAYLKSLQRLAADKGLSERLNWRGWVEAEEKSRLFAATDLLVLVSHRENFANAVLEALSAGVPALVTEEVGLADYVREKQFGWVCRPDIGQIRQTLTAVVSENLAVPHTRREMAGQVRRDFDPLALAARYIAAYNDNIKTAKALRITKHISQNQ